MKLDTTKNIYIPRRVVFVIDRSGSMSGSKLRKTIAATVNALKKLRFSDRFNVILFDDALKMLSEQMMIANEENIKKCIARLQSFGAGGCTNISAALDKAIQLIKADIVSLNVLHSLSNSSDDNYNF